MNDRWGLLDAVLRSAALLIVWSAGAQGASPAAARLASEQAGRPVRIVTISFYNKQFETIRDLVEAEAAKGTDMIVLPETWSGQKNHNPETLEGPTISALRPIATKHHTYIVSPIDRMDRDQRYNSVVLIARDGKVAAVYNKLYPAWGEYKLEQPVKPGQDAPVVYQADFGRVGFAVCFDVNFPAVWRRLSDEGAELVIYPSAYSAGSSIQAHAINHHYYIVSSTEARDSSVYDVTGKEILYEKNRDINISRMTLDLDRGIYHANFNLEKRDKLLKEHGDDVEQEIWMPRESWFVLKAKRPGVSARELARQYGLEELRDYLDRSRREIDRMRGFKFFGEDH